MPLNNNEFASRLDDKKTCWLKIEDRYAELTFNDPEDDSFTKTVVTIDKWEGKSLNLDRSFDECVLVRKPDGFHIRIYEEEDEEDENSLFMKKPDYSKMKIPSWAIQSALNYLGALNENAELVNKPIKETADDIKYDEDEFEDEDEFGSDAVRFSVDDLFGNHEYYDHDDWSFGSQETTVFGLRTLYNYYDLFAALRDHHWIIEEHGHDDFYASRV